MAEQDYVSVPFTQCSRCLRLVPIPGNDWKLDDPILCPGCWQIIKSRERKAEIARRASEDVPLDVWLARSFDVLAQLADHQAMLTDFMNRHGLPGMPIFSTDLPEDIAGTLDVTARLLWDRVKDWAKDRAEAKEERHDAL